MAHIITDSCVWCHSCFMECPESAVYLKEINYTIDPDKCTDCGHCKDICPVCAIVDPNEVVPEPEKHEPIHMECDLVVIGGGSGLVGAVRTAELTGKKVIVLEKAKKVGGATNLGHGFPVNYSRMHRKVKAKDTRAEDLDRILKEYDDPMDRELLKKLIYVQETFFDWLCDFGDAEDTFVMSNNMPGGGPNVLGVSESGQRKTPADFYRLDMPKRKYLNLLCEDQAVGPGWMGTFVIEKMKEQCNKLDIEILTEHSACEILIGEKGEVRGVVANDPGGQTVISCKACMIAAGCFIYNDELMAKVDPDFLKCSIYKEPPHTCTGDGIVMAEKIGAMIDYESISVRKIGAAHHPFGYCMYSFRTAPGAVVVNLDGRRFSAEGSPFHGALTPQSSTALDQPQNVVYYITDDALLEKNARYFIENPRDIYDGWIMEKYREEIVRDSQNGVALFMADTLDELGKKLQARWGTDPKVFVSEIEKYNRFCHEGVDHDFGKDPSSLIPLETPPFYASYERSFSEGSYGGIVTDAGLCVLKADGSGVIPGLFAAGDNTRDFQRRDDERTKPTSTMGWALYSNFLAADSIAEYLD